MLPNALNLVQVLDLLSRNKHRWERFFKEVRAVLPQIQDVTFETSEMNSGRVRASLWNLDPRSERTDLTVRLSQSGTGVPQVLAILYVVFTSDRPKIIIIDEPQSFLHPGAIRKLFEILQSHPQHQYIVTTHSPTVVTAANPSTLFLVRRQAEESTVGSLDVSETQQQSSMLKEVGARLADVFGADNILWVEGATEETCFPIILSEVAGHPLRGTKILGVIHTGDLEGKDARNAFRIYRKLSESSGGLLPLPVGYIFDQEGRSLKEQDELKSLSNNLVSFLPRKMFENYLVNPHAIAEVFAAYTANGQSTFSVRAVEQWLAEHQWSKKYFGNRKVSEGSKTDEHWLKSVHGAKLLEDLVADLSDATVFYRKVEHGRQITEWLCRHAPESLRELSELLVQKLPRSNEA